MTEFKRHAQTNSQPFTIQSYRLLPLSSRSIIRFTLSILLYGHHDWSCGNTMGDLKQDRERRLVEQCRTGSSEAWNELYRDYAALVRRVVRDQKWKPGEQDVEDVTQNVFIDLIPALKKFDFSYSLSQFISGQARRTTRDEIRRRIALKRNAATDPIDLHDGTVNAVTIPAGCMAQDDRFEMEELKELLRFGMARLSEKCRQIIRYRDFEELSFKEMEEILGEKENTLTVTRKRCLEQLTALCHTLLREECTR